MPVSGIYVIHNRKTGMVYIGQSYNIKQRWKTHKYMLNSGTHHNPRLQHAWNTFGEKAFRFLVLEYGIPYRNSNAREHHFIDIYLARGLAYNTPWRTKEVRMQQAAQS